jgi:23S rRNA-/tRNA-specific pseudouridylate synthase
MQNIPLDIVFEDDHLLVINKVSVQFPRQQLVS